MPTTAHCIYCHTLFDPTAGEGDHILSSAFFGEFAGDTHFRGICTKCNNDIGRLEQAAIRGSHLGFYRFLVRPKPGRSYRAGSFIPRGVSRATEPKFTVETDGPHPLLALSDEHPDTGVVVDHLDMVDETGRHFHVRLYAGMSVDRLRSEIEHTGITKPTTWYVNVSQQHFDELMALVSQVLIPSRSEEREPIEPGLYEGHTTAEFSVTKDFYRVLAKIGFHYYLVHNPRGLQGDEAGFESIRNFIKNGDGDVAGFFRTTGPTFATPFGPTASGKILCPASWCHILAAAEENKNIVGYLRFYLGPRALPDPHYVILGTIESDIMLPSPAFGHLYQVDFARTDKYAGDASPLTMTRIK
jgi:hypothetical protein